MKDFFAVLGGMGTMATETFVNQLNSHTKAHKDQDYLNYIVNNHATIPDRTAYILGESSDNPCEALQEDIKMLAKLEPEFFVITCNTAHHFYDELVKVTDIPILHMPRLAVKAADKQITNKTGRVMILATSGTIATQVYTKEFENYSHLTPVVPSESKQELVMSLIYDDIKENNYLNEVKYQELIDYSLNEEKCDAVILGCTELSIMQDQRPINDARIIDAQLVVVNEILAKYNKKES